MTARNRKRCRECGTERAVRADGTVHAHLKRGPRGHVGLSNCLGSRRPPQGEPDRGDP